MRDAGPMQTVLPQFAEFEGQEYPLEPGARQVLMYIKEPSAGIGPNTGIILLSHNWGGTWELTKPWCDVICDKFNLIAVSVNYLQSGWKLAAAKTPYDHGLLQACDLLRAVWHIRKALAEKGAVWNPRRCYAAGASGGGNVSQMANKLAPRSFACIVDLCGMACLSDRIAYGEAGRLNALYSRDPKHPFYLSPAAQEIRDLGNSAHLALQYAANPANQVVIVHGLDDDYCPVTDKITVFRNMIAAGFRPEGHFLTRNQVDGIIVTTTGHQIGDRAYVIAQFGKDYMAEHGEHILSLRDPDDFDRGKVVVYPVTGGEYRIDFSCGAPEIRFAAK